MLLTNIIKRASTLFSNEEGDECCDPLEYSDNEVLFCKNNVCVHPPTVARHEFEIIHHPGYLTVSTKIFTDQYNNAKRPTLFLNWIPNTTLKQCTGTLTAANENGKVVKTNSVDKNEENVFFQTNPFKYVENSTLKECNQTDLAFSDNSETVSLSSNSDKQSIKSTEAKNNFDNICENRDICNEPRNENKDMNDIDSEIRPLLSREKENAFEKCVRSQSMTSVNITIANPTIENIDITPDSSFSSERFIRSLSLSSCDDNSPNWMITPEFLALKHNLVFPDSAAASPVPQKRTSLQCRRFSVDLSQMRSLRLFFSDESCTCGQLVVASRESQYKILHFHHGGLDHLARVLHRWHSLLHNVRLTPGCSEEPNLPYRHFMVCRPEVQKSELHPEEGKVSKILGDTFYKTYVNNKGQIEDDLVVRKSVFFGGLDRELRKDIWPFLLHCYPYNSTFEERDVITEIRRKEYQDITNKRLNRLSKEERAKFRKMVQSVVEKDVVRTDRGNPFFAGENNPNVEVLKNILLNYAIYNPNLGYTQGMSDLLAPVLYEIKNEADAFWCFVGLMQRAIFVCTPTDNDMDINLNYLRELIRIMLPNFYNHLIKYPDAMELLFCHRWILLCFKREFTEPVALRMWEACWANYLTDYFHLFLCLAIIAVYAEDVIVQNLKPDEMLLHFSSLAMYMDGQLILRKARGLLHQYRQLLRIPCSLANLCQRCGPGIWDSTHHPAIECSGHENGTICNAAR